MTGHFDYGLVWGPPTSVPRNRDVPVDPAIVARAVQEQLGLHLEKRRMTVDLLNVVSAKAPADVVTKETRKPLVVTQAEADMTFALARQ